MPTEPFPAVAADGVQGVDELMRNVHQLAGQFANLELWLADATDAIDVIGGYPERFIAFAILRSTGSSHTAQRRPAIAPSE